MMKILFLHTNFPGQFKHICGYFGALGHDIRFLCHTHYGRKVKNVNKYTIKIAKDTVSKNLTDIKESSQPSTSSQYREAFLSFKSEGWIPDLVISHSGWGCGLHVKEIWPKTRLIGYLEWWFNPESELYTYDHKNKDLGISPNLVSKHWLRNSQIALELATADQIIAPTHWQKSQLPVGLQKNCDVIFDGIDFSYFNSDGNLSQKPVLTYGTRGMEPMRGFRQFIESLPKVLKKLPWLSIEIAGEDEINYAGFKPKGFDSWKTWAIAFLNANNLANRVTWKGRLGLKEYAEWLKSSWCHVYLTHPFVTSWSLVEAMSCNCLIICSENQSTKEFMLNKDDLIFVDHRNPDAISEIIITSLIDKEKQPKQQRSCIRRFDRGTSCYLWAKASGIIAM